MVKLAILKYDTVLELHSFGDGGSNFDGAFVQDMRKGGWGFVTRGPCQGGDVVSARAGRLSNVYVSMMH